MLHARINNLETSAERERVKCGVSFAVFASAATNDTAANDRFFTACLSPRKTGESKARGHQRYVLDIDVRWPRAVRRHERAI